MPTSDVVILGAGAIGSAIAWTCARRGLSVTVLDPDPDAGAWRTAAGMLAPITELTYTETTLLHLGLDSLARYPAFTARLEEESGRSVGYRESGTVCIAWDAADLAALRDVQRLAAGLGVDATLITGRELRELEPATAPGLPGALHAPGDHSVDPRLLHAALVEAARRRGVRTVPATATLEIGGGRVRGVRTDSGERFSAAHVIVAAGSWSARVAGLPPDLDVAVRPVKGQTLRLSLPGPARLTRVVRGLIKGTPIYVVPRDSGELVIGASTEEAGFDRRPRAGAVYELLRDAQSLVPELGEATLDEVCTALRPTTPDNRPIVGATATEGLILATGHYRNGILHSPVTAEGVAELITDGVLPDALLPFSPKAVAPAW